MTMSDQGNLAVILRVYDAFQHGDIPAILNLLDPQAELQFEGPSAIPWAGHRHGREGWAEFFQAVAEHLEDITLRMEPFAVQGDHVVAAGRYRARVKATGKHIDSPLIHLWTVHAGRIVRCQELTDTASEAAACAASAAVPVDRRG
jgi:ketosteroid isomerase-like protein